MTKWVAFKPLYDATPPSTPGCYEFAVVRSRGGKRRAVYVGSANNLGSRIGAHCRGDPTTVKFKHRAECDGWKILVRWTVGLSLRQAIAEEKNRQSGAYRERVLLWIKFPDWPYPWNMMLDKVGRS